MAFLPEKYVPDFRYSQSAYSAARLQRADLTELRREVAEAVQDRKEELAGLWPYSSPPFPLGPQDRYLHDATFDHYFNKFRLSPAELKMARRLNDELQVLDVFGMRIKGEWERRKEEEWAKTSGINWARESKRWD